MALTSAKFREFARPIMDVGYDYLHLNSTGVTLAQKSSLTQLHSITINSKGTSGNTLTVYDSTTSSGSVVAVIDTTSQVGQLLFDVTLVNGLSVVLATGGAADITISYR